MWSLSRWTRPRPLPPSKKGIGDVVVLWAPYTSLRRVQGYKKVGTSARRPRPAHHPHRRQEFCDKNPEIVAKFLRVYLRGVNFQLKHGKQPRGGQVVQKS